jgi:serine/threonine protein kinase
MKKWIVVVALSICCVAAISLIKIDETANKQIIYIKGGDSILADSVSQSDQFVYYKADGKTGMFLRDDVMSVGSIEVQRQTSLIALIDRTKQQMMSEMGFGEKTIRVADSRLLLFVVFLGVAFGIVKLAPMLVAFVKNRTSALPTDAAEQADFDTNNASAQNDLEPSDLRDIAMFFLDLFKLQHGIAPDAPARFSMTAASATRKMKVFELGVKGSSDWLTRRMSIGPLGEESGSKSRCFYVIYDTHMVVKIPPAPVTDMEKYVNDIRREVQIAAQLSPVACIVPMVSVVLKKVIKLPYESSLNQEQLEKRYIRLVEEQPEYQDYLKIGDRFAFFMELTNSFFLGRVIEELHKSKNNIGDEIREFPEVAWNQQAFTARYGLEALPVFDGLQTLYRRCEGEAFRIIKEAGHEDDVHTFQIKNWFLACISGEDPRGETKDFDASLLTQIKEGFSAVFRSNQQHVDDLIQILKAQLAAKTFLKNRQPIENIASNMLRLLCQLKEKRIVLRDLKPDNLFMDANPDDYPVFLNDESTFSIGVIDVETAVSLVPLADGSVTQPLIGGTPLYATPLNLLRNQTIATYFGNLEEALHLQDWFATMAIIFKAITGVNLFPRAARSFPAILKIFKSSRSKSNPAEGTVKAMSDTFWAAATTDIKTQLTAFADILNELTLSIPETMAPSIKAELQREETCLGRAIRKHVALSPLLKSEKNRAFLIEADSEAIVKQVERWKDPYQLPPAHRAIAPRMVGFLNNLDRLKQGAMEKRRAVAAFANPPHHISAYALLEAMFQISFQAMYRSRWKVLPKPSDTSEAQVAAEDDNSMVTTILNEK